MKRIPWLACMAFVLAAGPVAADVTIISQSALTPTTSLYTNVYGTPMVTTGGGNAANVGAVDGRNDDGFRGPISFGFTLANFFGNDYLSFYLNNNGNISFNQGISAFTPVGPQGQPQPIISPFFADVDTRGARSGLVYYDVTSVANQAVLTWDHVGYFGAHDNLLDTFQLVVRGSDYNIPTGEGQIGFFWNAMQWETGDASGGSGGFGGSPAAIGFGDGFSNGFVLEGSTQNGISRVVNNQYIWFNINAGGDPTPVITPVPEPETYALMLAGLGLLAGVARRRQKRLKA